MFFIESFGSHRTILTQKENFVRKTNRFGRNNKVHRFLHVVAMRQTIDHCCII